MTQPRLEIDEERRRLVDCSNHLLVLGGPGSGKTTISIVKAAKEIAEGVLLPGQKILFLSFARATVARVAEHSQTLVSSDSRKCLEINTYHGFAWNIIRSHGYLLTRHTPIQLITPPDLAAKFARITPDDRRGALADLFRNEGILGFDLFAHTARNVLKLVPKLASIYSDTYPIIILDEFQDTHIDEWDMVNLLGNRSRLIALADAEQRIYDFRGADPARIRQFIDSYAPEQFDFGTQNNRSNGTDICVFGNHLLSGANKTKEYNDVEIYRYPFTKPPRDHFFLKTQLLEGLKRLKKIGKNDWSIAILVPAKSLLIAVSDYLSSEKDRLPSISHEVSIDNEGPTLAAQTVACLLEKGANQEEISKKLLANLINHVRGRRGNKQPTKVDLGLIEALEKYIETGKIRGSTRTLIIEDIKLVAEKVFSLEFIGAPEKDWVAILKTLRKIPQSATFKQLVQDASFVRLLNKGSAFRQSLNEIWKLSEGYSGASIAIQNALQEEYFASTTKKWSGINVMTMHKSKGKEFDEVFVFEGTFSGRIVPLGASTQRIDQARLTLRVAVTRGISRTTIVTSRFKPCPLL